MARSWLADISWPHVFFAPGGHGLFSWPLQNWTARRFMGGFFVRDEMIHYPKCKSETLRNGFLVELHDIMFHSVQFRSGSFACLIQLAISGSHQSLRFPNLVQNMTTLLGEWFVQASYTCSGIYRLGWMGGRNPLGMPIHQNDVHVDWIPTIGWQWFWLQIQNL